MKSIKIYKFLWVIPVLQSCNKKKLDFLELMVNQDCPHCYDSVSDLKEHLTWCERRFINIAKRKLGLIK